MARTRVVQKVDARQDLLLLVSRTGPRLSDAPIAAGEGVGVVAKKGCVLTVKAEASNPED